VLGSALAAETWTENALDRYRDREEAEAGFSI
jgi:hypothetical protein